MSRAFTKEIDDAPLDIPERPISSATNLVTNQGAALIAEALADAEFRLQTADNTELASRLRRDIRYWAHRKATMKILSPARDVKTVGFGVTVRMLRNSVESRVRIVGEDEADPSQGAIAWTSPLARSLQGAEAGEERTVVVDGKSIPVAVIEIIAG